MFLIRTAFWLSLVILLLPAGNGNNDDGDLAQTRVDISAIDALSAARDTVSDISAFCMRNPDTCATGSAALRAFGQKAQNGARMVYEYLGDLDQDGTYAEHADTMPRHASDTLQAEDLEAPWQGPEA